MKTGILIVSYTRADTSEELRLFINEIKKNNSEKEVGYAYIKEGHTSGESSIAKAAEKLKAKGVSRLSVYPLLLTDGSVYRELTKKLEGLKGTFKDIRTGKPVLLNGNADKLALCVHESIKREPDEQVLIVGHGQKDGGNEAYMWFAERLNGFDGGFAYKLALLKGEHGINEALPYLKADGRRVIIYPLFLNKGHHVTKDLFDESEGIAGILKAEGLPVKYAASCMLGDERVRGALGDSRMVI